mgnify:FL=1
MHDESTHPIYQGVEVIQPDERKIIPLIGPGYREDHNFVLWIGDYYGIGNANEQVYSNLFNDAKLRILGVWDGISDFWMMAKFEAMPNDYIHGTALAIGAGAFE